MRFVRRASLVLSLTLIVAISVGYVARVSAVAQERDLGLISAAEVGASQMAAVIESVELAAATGVDPDTTAEAVAAANPSLGVCVVDDVDIACAGDGPRPSDDIVGPHAADRRSGDLQHRTTDVDTYESTITIDVDGPTISVVAQAPITVVATRGDINVWATTFRPAGTTFDGFAVENGVRQRATAVEAASSVFVVAATADDAPLPVDERRFYTLVFSLSVLLMLLAGITLFIEQRNLVERASFDPLTKLPNRGEFERRASEAIATAGRQESGVCLLLFDLNGFKLVNDTYGHHAGDEMLKVVGSRLRKAVRDEDIVARWGGDEFVVVMPGVVDNEMGERRALQLAEQISGRTRLDGVGEAMRVQVSVGVALLPQHGGDLATLVEAADQAMYQAKRNGVTCQVSRSSVVDDALIASV